MLTANNSETGSFERPGEIVNQRNTDYTRTPDGRRDARRRRRRI